MVRSEDAATLERIAAGDLLAAQIIFEADEELIEHIGFHLQQFIEKTMKASLQRHDIDYPKTHDLVILLELFPYEKVTEEEEIFAYILSRFVVESRCSMSSTSPLHSQQLLEKTKKFAEFIETLWDNQ